MERILPWFFTRDPVSCARELIGATFHWHGCEGRIVETEAYAATGDAACHASFRPATRAFMAAYPAGTAYVYLNYGVHWLFNILVKGPEVAGFVLLRALEPTCGIERMIERRGVRETRHLCSGPGKLTRALGIDGSSHGACFLMDESTGLRRGVPGRVLAGTQIGITRATELPWRFLESGSPHISRGFPPV